MNISDVFNKSNSQSKNAIKHNNNSVLITSLNSNRTTSNFKAFQNINSQSSNNNSKLNDFINSRSRSTFNLEKKSSIFQQRHVMYESVKEEMLDYLIFKQQDMANIEKIEEHWKSKLVKNFNHFNELKKQKSNKETILAQLTLELNKEINTNCCFEENLMNKAYDSKIQNKRSQLLISEHDLIAYNQLLIKESQKKKKLMTFIEDELNQAKTIERINHKYQLLYNEANEVITKKKRMLKEAKDFLTDFVLKSNIEIDKKKRIYNDLELALFRIKAHSIDAQFKLEKVLEKKETVKIQIENLKREKKNIIQLNSNLFSAILKLKKEKAEILISCKVDSVEVLIDKYNYSIIHNKSLGKQFDEISSVIKNLESEYSRQKDTLKNLHLIQERLNFAINTKYDIATIDKEEKHDKTSYFGNPFIKKLDNISNKIKNEDFLIGNSSELYNKNIDYKAISYDDEALNYINEQGKTVNQENFEMTSTMESIDNLRKENQEIIKYFLNKEHLLDTIFTKIMTLLEQKLSVHLGISLKQVCTINNVQIITNSSDENSLQTKDEVLEFGMEKSKKSSNFHKRNENSKKIFKEVGDSNKSIFSLKPKNMKSNKFNITTDSVDAGESNTHYLLFSSVKKADLKFQVSSKSTYLAKTEGFKISLSGASIYFDAFKIMTGKFLVFSRLLLIAKNKLYQKLAYFQETKLERLETDNLSAIEVEKNKEKEYKEEKEEDEDTIGLVKNNLALKERLKIILIENNDTNKIYLRQKSLGDKAFENQLSFINKSNKEIDSIDDNAVNYQLKSKSRIMNNMASNFAGKKRLDHEANKKRRGMKTFIESYMGTSGNILFPTFQNKLTKEISHFTNELLIQENKLIISYPKARNHYSLSQKKNYAAKIQVEHLEKLKTKNEKTKAENEIADLINYSKGNNNLNITMNNNLLIPSLIKHKETNNSTLEKSNMNLKDNTIKKRSKKFSKIEKDKISTDIVKTDNSFKENDDDLKNIKPKEKSQKDKFIEKLQTTQKTSKFKGLKALFNRQEDIHHLELNFKADFYNSDKSEQLLKGKMEDIKRMFKEKNDSMQDFYKAKNSVYLKPGLTIKDVKDSEVDREKYMSIEETSESKTVFKKINNKNLFNKPSKVKGELNSNNEEHNILHILGSLKDGNKKYNMKDVKKDYIKQIVSDKFLIDNDTESFISDYNKGSEKAKKREEEKVKLLNYSSNNTNTQTFSESFNKPNKFNGEINNKTVFLPEIKEENFINK